LFLLHAKKPHSARSIAGIKARITALERQGDSTMKVSYDDVRRTKTARLVMIDGHRVRVDQRAIKVWRKNPDAVFNAVLDSHTREYRMSGHETLRSGD
jgi:hypothetical protein